MRPVTIVSSPGRLAYPGFVATNPQRCRVTQFPTENRRSVREEVLPSSGENWAQLSGRVS